MVLLTLAIGLLNLGLGYAAAVCLGYAPAWHPPAGTTLPQSEPSVLPEEGFAAPAQGAALQLVAGPLEPAPAAQSGQDENDVAAVLRELRAALLPSESRLAEIDSQLRACQGRYDVETIHSCLEQFAGECETYVAQLGQSSHRFQQRISQLGALSDVGEQLEIAHLEHAAQVETTISNLRHVDFASDLEAAAVQLLTEIDTLRSARQKLHDAQDAAMLVAGPLHSSQTDLS